MFIWIRRLLAPPVFEDEEKTRAAGLLNATLLTTLVIGAVGAWGLAATATHPVGALFDLVFGVATTVVLLVLLFLTRRGYVRIASVAYSSFLLVLVTATIYSFKGVRNPIASCYFVVITVAALLLGGRAAVIFGLWSMLAALGVYYAEINDLIIFPLPASVEFLDWALLAAIAGIGTILLRYAVRGIAQGFERARLHAQELTEINRELSASREALQAQTRDLTRRARYLEATARVARETASLLDLPELLSRVVALISEQFGFYHTGVFLLDPSGEWAELRAASSEGGRRMLARGHRLRVGEQGIVGYVAGRGEPRIALDVGEDAVYFDNPDLPETRSEVALPLRARGEIIGALDVQSVEPAAFSAEDVAVLQTLADQVALAISNARLFRQAQEALEAEQRAYGAISREAWAHLVRTRPNLGFYRGRRGLFPIGDVGQLRETQPEATGVGDGAKRTIPVKVRGHTIGVIDVHRSDGAGEWTPEEIALLETLSEQLGVALESARLYQDTQRRAAQERLVGEVASRIRETLDMDRVLQTAIQAIGEALQVAEVEVRLGSGGTQEIDGVS